MPIQSIQSRSAEEWLTSLPAHERSVLYKYSPYCGVSARADHEIDLFMQRHPEVVIHTVDVIHERRLSNAIAQLVSVRHESPQLIVLERGHAVWNESHYGITRQALEEHLPIA